MLGLALLVGMVGCGHDSTGPAPLRATEAYWTLRLNYHAVNLALTPQYDTVRLVATPLTAAGTPIANAGPVTFQTVDSTVSVDSTGLVKANYVTSDVHAPTHIVVALRYQNITLADTVFIQVVATPPAAPLTSFTLHPESGLSTTCNFDNSGVPILDNCGTLVVNATDATGRILSSADSSAIVIAYTTSNPLVAQPDQSGAISEIDTGHVTFAASTWAYGVFKQDSLRYVISWPRYGSNQALQVTTIDSTTQQRIWSMPAISVSVGGTVAWINPYQQPIDIIFDDSARVQASCFFITFCSFGVPPMAGNIPPFYTDPTGTDTSVFSHEIAARSFPTAGTYHYHSRLFPSLSGVVYVRPNLTP